MPGISVNELKKFEKQVKAHLAGGKKQSRKRKKANIKNTNPRDCARKLASFNFSIPQSDQDSKITRALLDLYANNYAQMLCSGKEHKVSIFRSNFASIAKRVRTKGDLESMKALAAGLALESNRTRDIANDNSNLSNFCIRAMARAIYFDRFDDNFYDRLDPLLKAVRLHYGHFIASSPHYKNNTDEDQKVFLKEDKAWLKGFFNDLFDHATDLISSASAENLRPVIDRVRNFIEGELIDLESFKQRFQSLMLYAKDDERDEFREAFIEYMKESYERKLKIFKGETEPKEPSAPQNQVELLARLCFNEGNLPIVFFTAVHKAVEDSTNLFARFTSFTEERERSFREINDFLYREIESIDSKEAKLARGFYEKIKSFGLNQDDPRLEAINKNALYLTTNLSDEAADFACDLVESTTSAEFLVESLRGLCKAIRESTFEEFVEIINNSELPREISISIFNMGYELDSSERDFLVEYLTEHGPPVDTIDRSRFLFVLKQTRNTPKEDRIKLLRQSAKFTSLNSNRSHRWSDGRKSPYRPDFYSFKKELKAQRLINDIVVNANENADSSLASLTTRGSPPYPRTLKTKNSTGQVISSRTNPRYQKLQRETQSGYKRFLDLHKGFKALSAETKRYDPDTPSLLTRFGLAMINEFSNPRVDYVRANSANHFPGSGLLIQGLDTDRVFPDRENVKPFLMHALNDLDADEELKYYHHLDEIDDLENTRFIFLRGMTIISCNDWKYYQKSNDDDFIPYSYVVLNDHFGNVGDSSLMVPTKVIDEKLQGCTAPVEGFAGFQQNITKIDEKKFQIEDLIEAAGEDAVLNLGWSSNFSAGFQNAYEPGSGPYFRWENIVGRYHTRDLIGHVHSSHIRNRYEGIDNPDLRKALRPLRKGHKRVFSTLNSYQKLFDLFRLSYSQWKKGAVLESQAGEDQYFEEEGNGEEQNYNPNAARVLQEIYHIRNNLISKINQDKLRRDGKYRIKVFNQFPVMRIAHPLVYRSLPDEEADLSIDTYNMKLKVNDKEIQLPFDGDGTHDAELGIWYNEVVPRISRPDREPRLISRQYLTAA